MRNLMHRKLRRINDRLDIAFGDVLDAQNLVDGDARERSLELQQDARRLVDEWRGKNPTQVLDRYDPVANIGQPVETSAIAWQVGQGHGSKNAVDAGKIEREIAFAYAYAEQATRSA